MVKYLRLKSDASMSSHIPIPLSCMASLLLTFLKGFLFDITVISIGTSSSEFLFQEPLAT